MLLGTRLAELAPGVVGGRIDFADRLLDHGDAVDALGLVDRGMGHARDETPHARQDAFVIMVFSSVEMFGVTPMRSSNVSRSSTRRAGSALFQPSL